MTYYVRSHLGCKYDKGRRLLISGPTIGDIINKPVKQVATAVGDGSYVGSILVK